MPSEVIHPDISDLRRHELENAPENVDEPLSVQKMINHFRSHCRSRITEKELKYSKTNAVFATYEDQSTKDSTKKPKKDRCVCGGPHSYIKCWVLDAEERPSKWSPRKEIEDKVKKAVKNEKTKRFVDNAFAREKKTLAVASLHVQEDKQFEEVTTLATTTFSTDGISIPPA
ncbi:hypothetical protein ACJ72_07882 [Emergomyces africanus]|uniref:Uncharacterized protein n=1 Tax=Emergomyces africanus TaxID=1955775 RepID=A0A1B7NLX6_9EURO|nr:hypothetical protein ACJ72_07882 [Emergomyces africanus]